MYLTSCARRVRGVRSSEPARPPVFPSSSQTLTTTSLEHRRALMILQTIQSIAFSSTPVKRIISHIDFETKRVTYRIPNDWDTTTTKRKSGTHEQCNFPNQHRDPSRFPPTQGNSCRLYRVHADIAKRGTQAEEEETTNVFN